MEPKLMDTGTFLFHDDDRANKDNIEEIELLAQTAGGIINNAGRHRRQESASPSFLFTPDTCCKGADLLLSTPQVAHCSNCGRAFIALENRRCQNSSQAVKHRH